MFPAPFGAMLCSLLRAVASELGLEGESLLGIGGLTGDHAEHAAAVAVLEAFLAHDAHAEQARQREHRGAAERGALHDDVEEGTVALDEAKTAAHLLDLHVRIAVAVDRLERLHAVGEAETTHAWLPLTHPPLGDGGQQLV